MYAMVSCHCIQIIGPSCSSVAWADMQICGYPIVEHQVLKQLKHSASAQLSAGHCDHTVKCPISICTGLTKRSLLLRKWKLHRRMRRLFGVSGNMRPTGRMHHRPNMATEMLFSRLITARTNKMFFEKHMSKFESKRTCGIERPKS